MIVLAGIVLLLGSLFWVAQIPVSGKPAYLLALYVVLVANIILTGYIANTLLLLNNQWVFILIHALIGAVGYFLWWRSGKPSLAGPFNGWKPKNLTDALKLNPALFLLVGGVTLIYAFSLVQVVFIPQNNMDSLSTYLSRIGFWYQHGSFFPWPTLFLNQVIYPVNAQLQTYWTVLFLGNDRLVGVAQWAAALASGLAVWGLARELGYSRRRSAYSALVYLTFPLLILQSTTTQTDLVTGTFFVSAVYFLLSGLRTHDKAVLFLSAMSVGMGVGTKKSYLVLLVVLAVIALLLFVRYGKGGFRWLAYWGVSVAFAAGILGSYMYAVNWINYGSPFGVTTYLDTVLETGGAPPIKVDPLPRQDDAPNFLLEISYNSFRLAYQAIDTSGLPRPLDGYAHKAKEHVARFVVNAVGFDQIEGSAFTAPGHVFSFSDKNINEESHAWYGPLSFLLIAPALVYETFNSARKKQYLKLIPVAGLLVFIPLGVLLRPGWDPYQGRYYAPLVALCAPLMGIWFGKRKDRVWEWIVVIFALTVAFTTSFYNPAKPTLGKYADDLNAWHADRIFVQTNQWKGERDLYYMVDKFVPADATLGYYAPGYLLTYPMFGEHFTRKLIPLVSVSDIASETTLTEMGVEYLLLSGSTEVDLPASYDLLKRAGGWHLYSIGSHP